MGATVDCETIGPGFLGQPVNSLTSLALLVAAVVVARRTMGVWLPVALAFAGVGSFLFHGPLAPGGEWLHDTSLAWLIAVVGLRSRGWEKRIGPFSLVVIAAMVWAAPSLSDLVTVALAIVTLSMLLVSERRRGDALGPVSLLVSSAIVGRLGASGGPWCDPSSLLQTHALWHVGAAFAVGWWAIRHARSEASESDADVS